MPVVLHVTGLVSLNTSVTSFQERFHVLHNFHLCTICPFDRHVSSILADEMTGGKVLVFAHHRNVLDALEMGVLKRCGVEFIRIDGRTKVSAAVGSLVNLTYFELRYIGVNFGGVASA